MKRQIAYLILVISLGLSINAYGQQVQSFTQFQWAGITYNPAFAGSDSYFNALAIHRTQWTAIADAPRTYQMALHAPDRAGKMGFGGTIYTDVTGPTRRFGVQGTYAYHLKLTDWSKLSMGLSFGMTQFTIDGSQITLREAGDQALVNGIQQEIKPDGAFGLLWHGERFFLGISATQLLNNKLDLFAGNGTARMNIHTYTTAGYRFKLSEQFEAEPAVFLKWVSPVPVQIDISGRIIYKSNFWLGGTYRVDNGIALYSGYRILDYLALGYSYDINTSDTRNYTDGTHEIFIQLRFGKNQMLEN